MIDELSCLKLNDVQFLLSNCLNLSFFSLNNLSFYKNNYYLCINQIKEKCKKLWKIMIQPHDSLVAFRTVLQLQCCRVVVKLQVLLRQTLPTHRASQHPMAPSVNACLVKRVRAGRSPDQVHVFKLYQANCALNLWGIRTDVAFSFFLTDELFCSDVPIEMAQIIDQSWTDSKISGDPDSQDSTSDDKYHNANDNKRSQCGKWEKYVKHNELDHKRVNREIDSNSPTRIRIVIIFEFRGRLGLEIVDAFDGLLFEVFVFFGRDGFLFGGFDGEGNQVVIESDFLVLDWQNVGCGQSDGLRFLDGSRVRRLVFVCGFDLVLDFVEGLLFFYGFDLVFEWVFLRYFVFVVFGRLNGDFLA